MEQICIVNEESQAEIEVKKSRFIATIRPVHSEEEALAFIAEMKKKYWDARHNCSAFIIGDRQSLMRCSDDGEPQGTAGRPMLDVLQGAHLVNVCAVVTRYFGGTLLGTGGLVRAYSDAVTQGLAAGSVLTRIEGTALTVQTDYNDLGKVQYLLAKENVVMQGTEYSDVVRFQILLPKERLGFLKAEITEGTAARAIFADEREVRYAQNGAEIVLEGS